MTMGDRVAVLKDGLLQQVGTPRELYDHPDNVFVAGFIGSPAMNLLSLPTADGGVKFGDMVQPVPRSALITAGDNVVIGVRPEDLELSEHGIVTTVEVVEELGADAYVYATMKSGDEELPIIARVDGRRPPQKGEVVHFQPKEDHVHLFHVESGERLEG
jgi:multiple sugar transport system ATP-binding protein